MRVNVEAVLDAVADNLVMIRRCAAFHLSINVASQCCAGRQTVCGVSVRSLAQDRHHYLMAPKMNARENSRIEVSHFSQRKQNKSVNGREVFFEERCLAFRQTSYFAVTKRFATLGLA